MKTADLFTRNLLIIYIKTTMETLLKEKTKTTLVLLPDEVKELAQRVPIEKQHEVQAVLSQIFAGTADWERQVDAIEVKDIHDTMSIMLADVARKNAKTARVHAEKVFDAKRDEVQSRMQNDKLEDSLWLKSKQIMQLKFKAIEEKAEWKANFVKRYEAEQNELKVQLRLEKVVKFNSEVSRFEVEHMTDNLFDIFLTGLEKAHNDKIEAEKKIESDRLAKIEAERVKQEKIRKENERLRKEAIENQKKFDAEREQIRKDNEEKYRLAAIERKNAEERMANLKAKAGKERAELLAKAESERKEKERLAEEIRVKEQSELKAKKDLEAKLLEEKKTKAIAEKKAKLAPDKNKLLEFGEALNNTPRPEIKSIEAAEIMANINGMLARLNNYIVENANKL
jgi:hypothetical protein